MPGTRYAASRVHAFFFFVGVFFLDEFIMDTVENPGMVIFHPWSGNSRTLWPII